MIDIDATTHRILTRLGQVPERTTFPTLDEVNAFACDLAAEFPALASLTEIGHSAGGEALISLTIGCGERRVLVVGNPHPDEPIGLATIQHLADRLVRDAEFLAETNATWHFVLCIDPDGTRLNEGWYAGPVTRSNVARHFYRPPLSAQAEWTFPMLHEGEVIGEPTPETRALMRLIDEVRPELVASLHNANFGGGFFYVSGGSPDYWNGLTDLLERFGIEKEGGLPDLPGARTFAPAVFELTCFADTLAALGPDAHEMLSGGNTYDYAARHGAEGLIVELPLWTDPRGADQSSSGLSFRAVMRESALGLESGASEIRGVLDRLGSEVNAESVFYPGLVDALELLLETVADRLDDTSPEALRDATKAEWFMEAISLPDTLRLRAGGLLVRLLGECTPSPAVTRETERFGRVFEAWLDEIEADRPGWPVPIAGLVAVQAAAVLLGVAQIGAASPELPR